MKRTRTAVLGLAVLLAQGCGDGSGGPAGRTVRDSAGVIIVENAGAGAWEGVEGWRLAGSPALDLGSVGGDPAGQLHDVQGAVRLSDGRVIVANSGSAELRFFDAEGRHLRSVGGEGDGPGEFQNLSALGRTVSDTLVTYDWRARRLSVFGPDGGFVEAHQLQAVGNGIFFATSVGWLRNGVLVARTGQVFTPASAGGLHREPTTFLMYGPEGSLVDTLVRVPGNETYAWSGDRSIRVTRRPFGKTAVADVSPTRVAVAATDRYEVRVFGADGELRRVVRKRHEPLPVTREAFDAWLGERLARIDDPADRKERRRNYAEIPLPDRMPAFEDLVLDVRGNLWVQEHDPPGTEAPSRWSVFDPEGGFLGEVTMPRGFTPYEIGADYVLGRWRDELDVEHVQLYGLERPGA